MTLLPIERANELVPGQFYTAIEVDTNDRRHTLKVVFRRVCGQRAIVSDGGMDYAADLIGDGEGGLAFQYDKAKSRIFQSNPHPTQTTIQA